MTAGASPPRTALPLNYFGILLGLVGLGGAWSAAQQYLRASDVPAGILCARPAPVGPARAVSPG
ncbi:hypothetical protein ACFU8W_36445 [Streptomyces sp. NPDC057565]|uniref:hypothetical protein n=1 Tax=Streptomyces sp. NPDC057565 TaxID=3346169 RepID=UPI00369E8869